MIKENVKMCFANVTDKDKEDIKELLTHPLNFPNYSTSEDIRMLFDFLIGMTVFQFAGCLLFLLMAIYKWVLLFVAWLIFFGGYTAIYKINRKKNKKYIYNMIDEQFKEDIGLEIVMKEDGFSIADDKYSYSEVKYIIFYKDIHFVCLSSRILVASDSGKNIDEMKQFYEKYFEAEIIEKKEPFDLKKYGTAEKELYLKIFPSCFK